MKTYEIIKQFNSETKIKIACWLLYKPEGMSVSELEEELKLKRANISKQINEMVRVGILVARGDGRSFIYSFDKNIPSAQLVMIKEIVNAYNIVDEKKKNYKKYI